MTTVYRIVHLSGWVEFIDQAEAEAYRNEHHADCEIQKLQRDLSEDAS
jgi:hypothetical protein